MSYDELLKEAERAKENSYSPYSHFKVGAALLAESGRVYTGVNVENVSFGVTVCAERSALCAAVSMGERRFKALAVTADKLVFPCGICRQALLEFGDIDIILKNKEVKRLSELMPDGFVEF
jgi:cytidine deaminase